MTKVVMTGANGFLGWHVRAAAREYGATVHSLAVGDSFDPSGAVQLLNGAHRVIHLAGVNRGTDDDVLSGNIRFAEQLAQTILHADEPPRVVVFANSTQVHNGSVYGQAKATASATLRAAALAVGAEFHDVLLPNIFGEHGRPFYNAVTATFCHLLSQGEAPTVQHDKELVLLHAQDAADILLGIVPRSEMASLQHTETVVGLADCLTAMAALYGRGEIPDVAEKFHRDLFNTYRSYTFARQTPISLTKHEDARGSFFEIIRSHGGSGQSSFSTTAPGVSRGDHYHRRKIERFTVLSGTATISLRKLFTAETIEFRVDGEQPVAIDMPTMWTHKITNVGPTTLYTSFWTNDIFNPDVPDTIAEAV
jgi:UDP-2-acetamido-2,6-beta-L-arabino-hexul-4-ose reductase